MNIFELSAKVSVNKSQAVGDIRAIEAAGKKTSVSMGAGFQKLGDNVGKWIKRGAVVAAAAIAALGATSIKNFAKMDTGMREVFTLMPGLSEKAKKQMTADVKEISRVIGVLPNETIPALYQAISAGVPSDNVFEFMEVAGKAAIGGVTDLTTAVDALSSVVNAYGADVMSATQASDLMFTAVRLGKTTFEELSRYLFQVTPVAAAVGVKFGQIAAALAEITAKGVPTRVAATQLRQMLVELSKAGGETANIFEELSGKTFQDFMDEGNDLADVLALMQEYADANSISLMDMFTSVEGGMAALNLGGANLDSFRVKLGEMDESAGATEAAFGEMAKGIQFRIDQLAAWWQTVQINIGAELQAGLSQFLDWLEANQAKIEAGLLAMFRGLLNAVQWLIDHREGIKTALKVIAVGLAAIVAIKLGMFVASMLNPFTLALGVLIATVALFSKASDLFTENMEGIAMATGRAGEKVGIFGLAIQGFVAPVEDAIDALKGLTSVAGPPASAVKRLEDSVWLLTNSFTNMVAAEMLSEEAADDLRLKINELYEDLKDVPDLEFAMQHWPDAINNILNQWSEDFPELKRLLLEHVVAVEDSVDDQITAYDRLQLAVAAYREWQESEQAATAAAQLASFANVTSGIESMVGPVTGFIEKIKTAYRGLKGDSDATSEEVQQSWKNLVSGVASSMNSFLDSVSNMYRTNRELAEEHGIALEEIEQDTTDRLIDLSESRSDSLAGINTSAAEARQKEAERHNEKLEQIQRAYDDKMRRMDSDNADAAREAAFIRDRSLQDEAEDHAKNMTQIQTDAAADQTKIQDDYTTAVTDANQVRTDALDDEVTAYEEAKISIWDILKEMVRNVLVAVREELMLQSAKYLVMGGAALLSVATMALAPGYFLTAAALAGGATALAIAGFAKGGIATSPTVGMIAEAGVSEGVIPLTARNLAAIGRGIASASGFSREPLGAAGIPGLAGGMSVQLGDTSSPQVGDVSGLGGGLVQGGGDTHVSIVIENPVIRDDSDIDKIAEAVEDSFSQTRRGLGWTGAV